MLKKQLGELLFFKDILKVGAFSSEVELLISTHKTVGSLLSSGKEKSKEIFLQHTLSYLAIPPHLKTLAMDNKKEVDKRLYTWISAVIRKVWGGKWGGCSCVPEVNVKCFPQLLPLSQSLELVILTGGSGQ